MNCDKFVELEGRELEAHLSACSRCRGLKAAADALGSLRPAPQTPDPAAFWARIDRRPHRLVFHLATAAALGLCLGLGATAAIRPDSGLKSEMDQLRASNRQLVEWAQVRDEEIREMSFVIHDLENRLGDQSEPSWPLVGRADH